MRVSLLSTTRPAAARSPHGWSRGLEPFLVQNTNAVLVDTQTEVDALVESSTADPLANRDADRGFRLWRVCPWMARRCRSWIWVCSLQTERLPRPDHRSCEAYAWRPSLKTGAPPKSRRNIVPPRFTPGPTTVARCDRTKTRPSDERSPLQTCSALHGPRGSRPKKSAVDAVPPPTGPSGCCRTTCENPAPAHSRPLSLNGRTSSPEANGPDEPPAATIAKQRHLALLDLRRAWCRASGSAAATVWRDAAK